MFSQLKYNCGPSLAKFILTKSNKEYLICHKWCSFISFMVSFFRSLMPIIARQQEHRMLNLEYYDIWMIMMITILNYHYFKKNCQFLVFSYVEFYRQYHYLSQISNLLSSKKQEKYYTTKFYPTINFFDSVSLKSWSKIHYIFREYGEKFKLRVVSYLSFFIVFYIFVIFTIVTSFFLDNSISMLSMTVLTYEVSIVLFSLLIVFKKGSAINNVGLNPS